MFNQNSNRRWKRNEAALNTCNRAARRNASRILALTQPTGPTVTESTPSNATVQRVYARPYMIAGSVGFQVVRAINKPNNAVMGPFKTSRGAEYAAKNPTVKGVREAERLSKI